jgi:HK97 family phage prohead protease
MSIVEARSAFYTAKPTERRLRPFEARTVFVDPTGTVTDAPTEGGTERVGMTGCASTVETWYSVRDWLGEYDEMICAGAFTKALQENDDVRLLVNHDGMPLARTKSGTMNLREDSSGLMVDVPELDMSSPLAQTVRSAMRRGDVDQMSFAFRAVKQRWNDDYTKRWVDEVQLFDVSVVTYPANDTTNAKLRNAALPADTVDRLARGLALTEQDESALRAMLVREPEVKPAGPDMEARRRRQAALRLGAGV